MSRRTETAYKAEPQGESAQHDEAHPDLWGMVNAVVVQGKIMFLPGGEKHCFERKGRTPKLGFFVEQGGVTKKGCQPKRLNGRGGTAPANGAR